MKVLLLTFLTLSQLYASPCQDKVKVTCSLPLTYKGKPAVMDVGIYPELCGMADNKKADHRCMVARLCGTSIDDFGPIVHDVPEQLSTLCMKLKNPQRLLDVDKNHYIEVECAGNSAKSITMKLVAGKKRKTCPLPFKMP